MVAIFLLIGVVVLAFPIAVGIAGSPRTRGRERDRRLRYVAKHPEQVNAGDIARLLTRELPRCDVDLILDRAAGLGVKPWTMYSWIQRFDVHTLAVVIAAELSHEELLLHLGNGTVPDLAALEVFAAINGLPAGRPAVSRRTPAPRPALAARPATRPAVTAESGPVTTSPLPAIFEPGSWPYDQFTDLPAWPEDPSAEPGPLAA